MVRFPPDPLSSHGVSTQSVDRQHLKVTSRLINLMVALSLLEQLTTRVLVGSGLNFSAPDIFWSTSKLTLTLSPINLSLSLRKELLLHILQMGPMVFPFFIFQPITSSPAITMEQTHGLVLWFTLWLTITHKSVVSLSPFVMTLKLIAALRGRPMRHLVTY